MFVSLILVPAVPPNESPREKIGLVNPDVVAVNVSFAADKTVVPGDSDWIEIEGGGITTIVAVVLAALPILSEALIVSG